jgi:hypothetical protein
MDYLINDGIEWLKNKSKKIEGIFLKEGYRGILGESEIDTMNSEDADITSVTTQSNNLAQGITDYQTKFDSLTGTIDGYLGTSTSGSVINRNVYVNKRRDISATPYSQDGVNTCVANSSLSGLTDASTRGFDTAYPNNFSNETDAINACKLWAADSQTSASTGSNPANTYFAVTKNTNNKYKCSYGNTLTGTPLQYSSKKVAYVVKSSNDATRGGLFHDGSVGVYNENSSTSSSDPSNPYNIQATTVLTGYNSCNKLIGSALNMSSINATLGANCSTLDITPVNIRYITINASKDPNNYYPYIQISQLVVYGLVNKIGKILNKNNYPTIKAYCGDDAAKTIPNDNRGWGGVDPNIAIDGNIGNRNWPNCYASSTDNRSGWWKLDLGQEYPIYTVVYYNRGGCCPERANGMTMQFQKADGSVVSIKDLTSGQTTSGQTTNTLTLNENLKQTFIITS